MARTSKQRAAADLDQGSALVNGEALADADRAMSIHQQQVALVAEQYAVDMPYDYERFIARGRELVVETGLRLVELGLLLIHVREREEHGRFTDALGRIGVAPRFAQRAMQAAVKLKDRPNLQKLGVTKALELLAEDGDTLVELERGGTVANLTLDEIDQMSVREVREALRRERQERDDEQAANDQIVADDPDRHVAADHERDPAEHLPLGDAVAATQHTTDPLGELLVVCHLDPPVRDPIRRGYDPRNCKVTPSWRHPLRWVR